MQHNEKQNEAKRGRAAHEERSKAVCMSSLEWTLNTRVLLAAGLKNRGPKPDCCDSGKFMQSRAGRGVVLEWTCGQGLHRLSSAGLDPPSPSPSFSYGSHVDNAFI